MEQLNEKDKKILQRLSTYMKASGLKHGVISFYIEDTKIGMDYVNNFSNNWTVEIPEWSKPTLHKILNICEPRIEYLENYSFNNLDMDISAVDKLVTVQQNYGYYEDGDEQYDEIDDPERVEIVFKDLFENPDIRSNKEPLVLRYQGSSDSGYLEDYFDSGEEVPKSVENLCYDFLEQRHGGWEINEGSNGQYVFDLANKTISLNHTFMEEREESEDLFSFDFGN